MGQGLVITRLQAGVRASASKRVGVEAAYSPRRHWLSIHGIYLSLDTWEETGTKNDAVSNNKGLLTRSLIARKVHISTPKTYSPT